MRFWKVRSRGVLYVSSLVIVVWLTSMVTLNMSTIDRGTSRTGVNSLSVWLGGESTTAHGYSKKRMNPDGDVASQISEIARALNRANAHVRGTKTSDELRHAIGILDNVLVSFGINKQNLINRPVFDSHSVCPETYMGSTFGYPFFYKGFETSDCQHSRPLSDLVTIVAYVKDTDETTVRRRTMAFIESVIKKSNLTIVLATNTSFDIVPSLSSKVIFRTFDAEKSDGWIWNNLTTEVRTPYVLIAREADVYTEDARLERLVREMEMMQVSVSAGAVRYPNGHWKKGCYQSVHRNFTLKYLEGYDESLHECLFCDYVLGPFVTSTENLKSVPFTESDVGEGLFEDWFLQLSKKHLETIVCPDAMFQIRHNRNETNWKSFMEQWGLYKFVTPQGKTSISDCSAMASFTGSRGLSPCHLQANADAVKFIMSACEMNDIICELQEGTSLGAVKLEKVLPWERDADITFLSANYTAFQKLKTYFIENSFRFVDKKSQWCCVDNRTAGGIFNLGFLKWNIEMYGQHIMDSEMLLDAGLEPTRVQLDGSWVRAPRNPGLFVRNRYGHEIYQHAVHWMTSKAKSGWAPYSTNVFPPCDTVGHHACLDRYNADGDLAFSDILP